MLKCREKSMGIAGSLATMSIADLLLFLEPEVGCSSRLTLQHHLGHCISVGVGKTEPELPDAHVMGDL